MHENNLYKLPPEILRGTTRILVLVAQTTRRNRTGESGQAEGTKICGRKMSESCSTLRVKLRESKADREGFAEDEIRFFAFKGAAFGDEGDQVASGTRRGQQFGDSFPERFFNVAEAVVGAASELHERELRSGIVQVASAE